MIKPENERVKPQDNIGRYTMYQPSLDRRIAMDAFAALRTGHPMFALLELDVTQAEAEVKRLQQHGERISLFSFLVHCIAVAISEHPDLNLVRHGRSLLRFEDVDVSVPVEIASEDGVAPREVVIRRAQHKRPQAIYSELEAARQRHGASGSLGEEDRWTRRIARAVSWLPGFFRRSLVRWLIRDGFRIKQRAGTTLVSSVGKFASIPGFSFTFSTGPRAAVFVVGGVYERPWVRAGSVVVRSVLPLSILIDHDLVDGGPAARFAQRLQQLIESAEGLSPQAAASTTVIPPPAASAPRSRIAAAT